MTVDHLLKEEDIFEKCLYCGKTFDPDTWLSDFYFDKHYKEIRCECGKTHRVKGDFSSGHDSWIPKVKKKIKGESIEVRVLK